MKIGEAFNQGMHGIAKKAIGCPWLVFGTRKWVANMKPGCKPKRIHSNAPNTLFSVKCWRFAPLLDSEEFPAADETGNYTHSFSDNRYHGHSPSWCGVTKIPVDGHSCGRKHLIFLKSIIFFSLRIIEIHIANLTNNIHDSRISDRVFPEFVRIWPRLCTALASRSGWTNLCDAHQDSSEAISSKIIGDWYSYLIWRM